MATLRYGSSGDEVKRLQQALNRQGYGLTVDGIYGTNTQNAVTQYQKKNNLSVDGIAGNQTLGRLYGGGSQAAQAATAAEEVTNPEQNQPAATAAVQMATSSRGTQYNPAQQTATQADLGALEASVPTFQQTQALSEALNALQQRVNARPTDYVSPYSQQIAQLYEQATAARNPFQYDPNADPLYQMYKDRYIQNARQSMQDTMANAAGLTGGYGNSYAAAAAQQAYDEQINGLNDVLPELYGQAYERWLNEGNDVLQRLQLAQNMDETAYGRWKDTLADYYDQLNAERTLANDMYDREYGQYADQLAAYQNDRDYYWAKEQAELAQRNYENELAMQLAASSGGGGGGRSSGGGGGGTSANYKTISKTASGMDPKDAYAYIGRMVDGGYLTPEEGEKILSIEMGIDMSKYATGNQSGTAGKNNGVVELLSGLDNYTGRKNTNQAGVHNTATQTLENLYAAAGIDNNTSSSKTSSIKALASNQSAKQKATDEELKKKTKTGARLNIGR